MRRCFRNLAGIALLAGLTACGGKLPFDGNTHEAPSSVSAELLAECTNRLKTYKEKRFFDTLNYKLAGPLRFSPGFSCRSEQHLPSGYKFKSYIAPITPMVDGRVAKKPNPKTTFLLCEYAQVGDNVVLAKWHAGSKVLSPYIARKCGLRTRSLYARD